MTQSALNAAVVMAVMWVVACSGTETRPNPLDAQVVDAQIVDAQIVDAQPDAALDAAVDAEPDAAVIVAPGCSGRYDRPQSVGPVGDEALLEASGIVASRRADDVLWLHNDSGDRATLYALSANSGRSLGRAYMLDVEAVDFEDIAAGPCPGAPDRACLWIADVGDNGRARPEVIVYVVAEPDPDDDFARLERVATLTLQYPEGPTDAEALVVAPDGSALWIIEKPQDADFTRVFTLADISAGAHAATLQEVASFAAPGIEVEYGRLVTGADLHPSGTRLIVRVYTGTFEYHFAAGQGMADLGEIEPVRAALGPLAERQGEAICYDAAGLGLWSVSEAAEAGQPLHHYACLPE
jgi:hypothetical protein